MGRRQATSNSEMKEAVCDYIYHLCMKRSSSECSIMVLFSPGLQAYIPLGSPDKLANPDFPIPISFVMGRDDWVRYSDEDFGENVVGARKGNYDQSLSYHEKGHYHICPGAGHNMHMDNPNTFADIIIKDLLGQNSVGEFDFIE